MSKVHELKVLPEYYGPVEEGSKPFEIRKDDRGYAIRDLLVLKEFAEVAGEDGQIVKDFTGKAVVKEVTYTTNFSQLPGYVVMGIKEPSFELLCKHFGYDKAANLSMGMDVKWVLEEATQEDLEANIEAVDSGDVS